MLRRAAALPSLRLRQWQSAATAAASSVAGSDVRVRYAPSPTGSLHLGGLRTALYNVLFAAREGGTMVLRLEDTDQTRKVEGAAEALMETMRWAGLTPDEGPFGCGGSYGPYVQSERLPMYAEAAERLLDSGAAYRCFCSEERLELLRSGGKAYDRFCAGLPASEVESRLAAGESHTIRLSVPPGSTVVQDAVRGAVRFPHAVVDDGVLLKSDGFPTYHLACVVDDHAMRISHVIRGEEWLSSTPKHVLLYDALGWEAPVFAHVPLLLGSDGGKLSKRHGAASVEEFIDQGYLPDALLNFVALLGWGPGDRREVFTLEELKEAFSLQRVNASNAVVDLNKLRWLSGEHIKLRTAEKEDALALLQEARPHWPAANDASDDYAVEVLMLLRERVSTLADYQRYAGYFFHEPDWSAEDALKAQRKAIKGADTLQLLRKAAEELESVDEWKEAELRAALKRVAPKLGAIFMPMRYALTGTTVGAGVTDTMELLGKELCMTRLQSSVARLEEEEEEQKAA